MNLVLFLAPTNILTVNEGRDIMASKKITRRSFFKKAAVTTLGAGAVFYGPWKHNRVYASQTDKPILIGMTSDASGQFANSGASDRRGMMMAIDEFNQKGGVLGRKIEHMHIDTESNPATGSRAAERMITRNEATFLIGALSSGVANAISQVASLRVIMRSAARLPVAGLLSVSICMYSILRPKTPPFWLNSSMAIIMPRRSEAPLLAN